jgi:D-xylonolactonase
MAPTPTPTLVADVACNTGENPLWHPDEGRLYWCDIPRGHLYAYDPAADAHERVYAAPDDRIGGFTIQRDGSLLLFGNAGGVSRFADGRVERVIDPDPDRFHERFNDVIADPEGRVFCGVMPDTDAGVPGALYRLDRDGTFTRVIDELGLPNGMGFTGDRESLYVTDTGPHPGATGRIDRYDYDAATGAIADPETVVEPDDVPGRPDGMTVDAEDHLWSAFWDGHVLVRYAPDGSRLRTVEFGPRKVSSVTFGGADATDAYVTTAGGHDRPEEGATAGSLFRVDLGVAGRPEFRSAVET